MPLRDESELASVSTPLQEGSPLTVNTVDVSMVTDPDKLSRDADFERQYPIYSGLRARFDLKNRNGGLVPGRDNAAIQAHVENFLQGGYSDIQMRVLAERNPGAAPIFQQAITEAKTRKTMNEQLGKFFQDPQNPDFKGAAVTAVKMGRLDLAQKFVTEAKQLNEDTTFAKELLAAGIQRGSPEWKQHMQKRLAREEAPPFNAILNNNQPDSSVIDFYAQAALKDKSILNVIGQRDPLFKRAVDVRMAELAKAQGYSGEDIVTRQAGFKSDAASLTALTKQYDAVTAFEKNAIRNGDVLIKLADKVDATGVPALERWIRGGKKATGSPDVNEMLAQMQIYRTEAAKILTNPNLTGVLSDSARKEVEEFLSGNLDAPSIRRVVNRLKSDFMSRKATTEEQIVEIKSRMKKGKDTQAPSTNPPVGGVKFLGFE